MFPSAVIAPPPLAGGPPSVLGPMMFEIDANGLLSLDFLNTIPETDREGIKMDYGKMTLGCAQVNESNEIVDYQPVVEIDSTMYDQTAYEQRAGMIDIEVSPEQIAQLQDATKVIVLQLRTPSDELAYGLLSKFLTAHTDQRGFYLDAAETKPIRLQVRHRGATPPSGTRVGFRPIHVARDAQCG